MMNPKVCRQQVSANSGGERLHLIEQIQAANLHITLLRSLKNDGLERQPRQRFGVIQLAQVGLHALVDQA